MQADRNIVLLYPLIRICIYLFFHSSVFYHKLPSLSLFLLLFVDDAVTGELSKLLNEIKICRDKDCSFEELCQTISSHSQSMESFGSGRLSDEERNGTLTRINKVCLQKYQKIYLLSQSHQLINIKIQEVLMSFSLLMQYIILASRGNTELNTGCSASGYPFNLYNLINTYL